MHPKKEKKKGKKEITFSNGHVSKQRYNDQFVKINKHEKRN